MTAPLQRGTVVTFGEALVRLSPPGIEQLASTRSLEVHPGGSEANVAAGIATLGGDARFVSRLPEHPLADMVLGALRRCNVDVANVVRGDGRLGTYYLEQGAGIRASRVHYDRADSAFTHMTPEDLTDAMLDAVFASATWLHVSGINLAIERAPVDALTRLWASARERGINRSFDVNRRATLPEAPALASRSRPFLQSADVVFIAERDAHALYGSPHTSLDATLDALRTLAPDAHLFVTRGEQGAVAVSPMRKRVDAAALPVQEVGRIGRGDAFAAGALHALNRHETLTPSALSAALSWGVACASYKSTSPGDLPVLDADAIEVLTREAAIRDVER